MNALFRPALVLAVYLASLAQLVTPLAARAEPEGPIPPYDMPSAETEAEIRGSLLEGESQAELGAASEVDAEALLEGGEGGLPAALAPVPGLWPQSTNRGAGAPIIRGLIGPSNLLVFDGIRLNTGAYRTGPNQYLAMVSPYSVGRLVVRRGPSSLEFGNGAMGGVVSMESLAWDAPQGERGDLLVGGADLRWGGRAESLRSLGRWQLHVGVDAIEHGALRVAGGDAWPASDFREAAWRAGLSRRLGSRDRLMVRSFGRGLWDAGRTDRLGQGDLRYYNNTDQLSYLRWAREGEGAADSTRQATLLYRRTNEAVRRRSCDVGLPGSVESDALDACVDNQEPTVTRRRFYEDSTDVVGGTLRASWPVAGWNTAELTMRAGAEAYFETIRASLRDARASEGFEPSSAARGNFSSPSRYTDGGVFGLLRYLREGTQVKWTAEGGVRGAYVAAEAGGVPGIGRVQYEYQGLSTGFYLGGEQHRSGFGWYGSFAQGFRAPNLQETTVLGDTGSKFEVPNPNLEPERSDTFELGLSHRGIRQGSSRRLVAYQSNLRSLIGEEFAQFEGSAEVDGKPVVRRVNQNEATYRGLEASLRESFPTGWGSIDLLGSAAWFRGEVADGGEKFAARRGPPLHGLLRADARVARGDKEWRFWGQGRAARAQTRLNPVDEVDLRICETGRFTGELNAPCQGSSAWFLMDAGVDASWSSGLGLGLRLGNILDAAAKPHGSGLPFGGRNALISLRFRPPGESDESTSRNQPRLREVE